MRMIPSICVVGSCNLDLIVYTPRLPQVGETLTASDFQTCCGGKGANQAVMAARLGARVSMVGKVGRDLFGDRLLANFREQGVDTAHVLVDAGKPSGVATILVDAAANNCILVVPGANGALTPDDVRAAAPAITAADILLCQLEVPPETTTEALRLARAAGVKTILNPAPAVPLADEVLSLADLCVPNETELRILTGLSSPAEGARALLTRGPGAVLVTLGERGVLVATPQGCEAIAAVAVRAVDPSGAGDAFVGSLAVFLAEGAPLAEAARRANAVAALSVTRPGTQPSFPTRAEIAPSPQR
jgi:ribokinase